ncbi:MAG TPA: xanthine dehydrogenase family protein subunit M [Chloroflexota bacterium]|nr:xanthine dehydrogenase family protein subunit M [Chloroflexota bacterium]
MYPAPFDYVRAGSVAEAVALLAQHGGEAKPLAGGHSLLPLMKLRLVQPKVLVDIGRLAELRGIREDDGALVIGATTRHAEVARSPLVQRHWPGLAEAAGGIGDLQVRNRGTLGGSLAHADPAADLPAVAVALGAELLATGPQGPRTLASETFFVDMLTTALGEAELLTAIRFPSRPARTGSAYVKIPHPASGYALVGCAARVVLAADGRCQEVRVVLSGVGPVPQRAVQTEQQLLNQPPEPAILAAAAMAAAAGLQPWDDLAASAEYRQHLATVCARRALTLAAQRAQQA